MRRALALVGLFACHATERRDVDLPTHVDAPTPPPIASVAAKPHVLVEKPRPFTVTKLAFAEPTLDVFVRGTPDPDFTAKIDAATKGLQRRRRPVVGHGRIAIAGESTSGPAILLFDTSARLLGQIRGAHPFFLPDGRVGFHDGNRVGVWDGQGAPRMLGADQPSLCVAPSCKRAAFPIALSPDLSVALVGVFGGGFVSDDEAFRLDLGASTTQAVVSRSKDTSYLSGTTMADGTYCSFRTKVGHGPGEPGEPGVLLCFAPPWDQGRELLATEGGAYVALGGVAGKVVTGDVHTIHVLDPRTGEHVAYPSPAGGGLIMPLDDGRDVAIEGDDAIVVVDLVAETFASYPTKNTVVFPLGPGVKGFVSSGDGTGTLVTFE